MGNSGLRLGVGNKICDCYYYIILWGTLWGNRVGLGGGGGGRFEFCD